MELFRTIAVPGALALSEWRRLRALHTTTGLYPILIGDDESAGRLLEPRDEEPASGAMTIAQAAGELSASDWFTDRLRTEQQGNNDTAVFEIGAWSPPSKPLEAPSVLQGAYGRPPKQVHIALLPILRPSEAFAALDWGGWNACPYPAEHVALHAYWADRYGSEVVAITDCEVECLVTRPPVSVKECNDLAVQQALYCDDLHTQIHGSMEDLARVLYGSGRWYFWWD